MGGNALTPVDVLASIHDQPRKLQSDFCRQHALHVARLASLGLITSRIGDRFGNSWRCTWRGLKVLDAVQEDTE